MAKRNLLSLPRKELKDAIIQIIIAVLVAVVFRSFVYEPYKIPSGSMKPTLILGDCVFVSKFSYGYSRYSLPYGVPLLSEKRIFAYSKPKRGDVIVFRGPKDPSITYIKRLIGLPGDSVQVINGIVYINSEPVRRTFNGYFYDINDQQNIKKYIETLPNHRSYDVLDRENNILDNTTVFIVPDNNYFFIGDNRDQSADSRILSGIGYVDEKFIVGKAEIIFFSAKSNILTLWNLFRDINFKRSFTSLIPENTK